MVPINFLVQIRALLLIFPLLVLTACGATSQFAGYVTAGPIDAQIVRQGGYSPKAMAQIAIVQNPDINGGLLSPEALQKIQEYSISCQHQIDAQLAGAAHSGINGAVPYSIAGTGTGPAAAAAFSGASMLNYSVYGGLAYLLPGAVNGLVTGSYSMASAKGSCTRAFWEDIVTTNPKFRGTHIVIVYGGKAWGNSRPPTLRRPWVVRENK